MFLFLQNLNKQKHYNYILRNTNIIILQKRYSMSVVYVGTCTAYPGSYCLQSQLHSRYILSFCAVRTTQVFSFVPTFRSRMRWDRVIVQTILWHIVSNTSPEIVIVHGIWCFTRLFSINFAESLHNMQLRIICSSQNQVHYIYWSGGVTAVFCRRPSFKKKLCFSLFKQLTNVLLKVLFIKWDEGKSSSVDDFIRFTL